MPRSGARSGPYRKQYDNFRGSLDTTSPSVVWFSVSVEFSFALLQADAGYSNLAHVPAGADLDGAPIGNVFRNTDGMAREVDGIGPRARVDTKLVRGTIRHLHVQRRIDRKVRLNVVTIDAIEVSGLKPPGCDEI